MHKNPKREIPCKQQGFSLIQVLVSVAILSMISAFYMQMNKSGLRNSKNIETNMEIIMLVSEIGNHLGNSTNCVESFRELDFKSSGKDSIEALMLKNNNDELVKKYKVGKSVGNSVLKIVSYELNDSDTNVDVDLENSTYLLIEFNRGKIVNRSTITKKIKINIQKDENDKLINCYASGFANSGADIEIVKNNTSGYICGKTGKLRFNNDVNSLQVCGADNIWYSTLLTCPPAAVKTCPTNSSVFRTCSSLGIWGAWTGQCDP